ncbi:phospholipase/carboxylesterase family protein [Sulfurimonas gotlandica GD1]|uniref:Phospholipase/carboxylesterase family protein n=1 Tax=Sulfurimonas gotlandica (strain DSM 19862 / JCM 16533 / GD1) TaxID=929558 RepID=B6BLQ0_SULGG|nr:alpha/beta fold hydrolase [Sulfurimonas gotlandica]EDZ62037.1 serine esterase [Sulfurimonas gotlandica GD1]EHP28709.1 phospholipase/carboxylesterase family protein [Sulfurimonas gotlandica GD1]
MKNLELDNIFIPSKIPSKKLMIILHGRGDSSEGFTSLPPFLDIDEMNYLLLDAPFEYYTGFSWYPLPPDQLPGIEYSSNVLTKVLDELFEEKFNANESFLFGFSQGSLLTFEFGARYSKVLAGYIAVSGYIYNEHKLLEDMNQDVKNSNWLCTHGIYDDVLPFETSKEQVRVLKDAGFDIEFKSYEKDHSIDRNELVMISEWMRNILE